MNIDKQPAEVAKGKCNLLGQTPMEVLLEALAEQCCELEQECDSFPFAHFDRSKAEILIQNYIDRLPLTEGNET